MSYYRVKYIPTYTHVSYDEAGNETGREVRQHLRRDNTPVVRSVVVFGLDKVNRVLSNNAERVSVRRLLMKRDETTAEEIAAGVAAHTAAQRAALLEARRREVAELEALISGTPAVAATQANPEAGA